MLRFKNGIVGQKGRVRNCINRMQAPKYLNLGSGPRGLEDRHWINIDGFLDRNVHFLLDLSRELPFDDCSFEGVFCEHVLEHFTLEEGGNLAREVNRILKPLGTFRIAVPDAGHVLRGYLEDPKALIDYRAGAGANPTAMEVVNMFFRQRYEHQFLYDWETMQKMLESAGFKNIERSEFGHGRISPAIVLDDEKYARESLYVEAQKL